MSTARPFRLSIAERDIANLRVRLLQTRWPDEVNDEHWSYGTAREYLRELTRHWRDHFDWRAAQNSINAFDQYLLEIDGLDLHFIHQRSKHPNATPLILTHGWPGSIVEFLEVIPRLTEPERFGGKAADAFHVVCPSLPGYGCSPAPRAPGMHPGVVAVRHANLMASLGYQSYIAQGGDWGSPITRLMASRDPAHCRAIHVNLFVAPPPGNPEEALRRLNERERGWVQANQATDREGMGYRHIQNTRPQTLGYGLQDSPVGLCAWITEKFHFWMDCERNGRRDIRNTISWDRLLTNISLYWVTGTITSSIRLYREFTHAMARGEIQFGPVKVPTGVAVYPGEIYKTPRSWVESSCQLVHWFEAERGGHFAALEQPQIFSEDLWRFHHTLRERKLI